MFVLVSLVACAAAAGADLAGVRGGAVRPAAGRGALGQALAQLSDASDLRLLVLQRSLADRSERLQRAVGCGGRGAGRAHPGVVSAGRTSGATLTVFVD